MGVYVLYGCICAVWGYVYLYGGMCVGVIRVESGFDLDTYDVNGSGSNPVCFHMDTNTTRIGILQNGIYE